MPTAWNDLPVFISEDEAKTYFAAKEQRLPRPVIGPPRPLLPERIALLATRIRMRRAGASLQVSEDDVVKALAGERTRATQCMALTLREITEEELNVWIVNGLITEPELRCAQALDPRNDPPE